MALLRSVGWTIRLGATHTWLTTPDRTGQPQTRQRLKDINEGPARRSSDRARHRGAERPVAARGSGLGSLHLGAEVGEGEPEYAGQEGAPRRSRSGELPSPGAEVPDACQQQGAAGQG